MNIQQRIFIRRHSVKRCCIFLQKMCSITLLFLLAARPALIPARLISSRDDPARESMEMYDDSFVGHVIAAGGKREGIDAGDTGKYIYFVDRSDAIYADDDNDVGDRSDGIYADDIIDVGDRSDDIYADDIIDVGDRSDDIYADDIIDVGDRSDDIYAGDYIDVGERTEDIAVGTARDDVNDEATREAKDDTISQLTTKVNNMAETNR